MLLQNDYFRNRDIDWFIQINDMPIHVASGGGALPYIIQEDFERNKKLLREINRRPNFFLKREILIRSDDIQQILKFEQQQIELILSACHVAVRNNNIINTYIEAIYSTSFIKYACKGFTSFDKTNINDSEDENYHLVASPPSVINPIDF